MLMEICASLLGMKARDVRRTAAAQSRVFNLGIRNLDPASAIAGLHKTEADARLDFTAASIRTQDR